MCTLLLCRSNDKQKCECKNMNTQETEKKKQGKKFQFENTILVS